MSGERPKILVVDDEHVMLRAWSRMLPEDRYAVTSADRGAAAIDLISHEPFDAVVVDLMMPGGVGGMEVLRHAKTVRPEVEVLLMTAYATVETAVEALKAGAYDYLVKPFDDIDDAVRAVERAVDRKRLVDRTHQLEEQIEVRDRFGELVGTSSSMKAVFEMVMQVAWSTATVLVHGESGTGKELIARAIHFRSPRKDRPFVPVNCGALTETLLESELFGHERGAFTGATGRRKGLFEAADGGTIFLDEIGEVSPAMQVRLLRVLQEGEVKLVGSNDTRHVDVRVIGATNKDLRERVRAGKFREDLYFRLNVINLELPPLRDRTEDVPPLAYHFLKIYSKKMGKEVTRIAPEAMARLQAYRWEGNVRELQNVMERAVVLHAGDTVEVRTLPEPVRGVSHASQAGEARSYASRTFAEAKQEVLDAFERSYVTDLLRRTQNNKAQAARLAGMDRANFRRVLKKYDVETRLRDDE